MHRVAQRVERGLGAPRIAARRGRAARRPRGSAGRADAASRKRAMTGVRRTGPGSASRATIAAARDGRVVVARHRAVAPRPVDVDAIGARSPSPRPGSGRAAAGDRHRRRRPHSLMAPAAREPLGPLARRTSALPRQAARLLVGGAGEEHVAAEPGDRVAGRIATGRAGLGGEHPDDAELHRDQVLHVHRAAARRRSRRRGPPRTGRASSARAAPARRRGATSSRSGSPPVPSPRSRACDGAATRDRLEDLRLESPASRERAGDPARGQAARRPARRRAAG